MGSLDGIRRLTVAFFLLFLARKARHVGFDFRKGLEAVPAS